MGEGYLLRSFVCMCFLLDVTLTLLDLMFHIRLGERKRYTKP